MSVAMKNELTLENFVKGLIKAYTSCKVTMSALGPQESTIIRLLSTMLKNYYEVNASGFKKYVSLMQIEYFLITDFSDIDSTGFNIEDVYALFDKIDWDYQNTIDYFFNNGYLAFMMERIVEEYIESDGYSYNALAKAYDSKQYREIIEHLHPDIKAEDRAIERRIQFQNAAILFGKYKIECPLEYYLGIKELYTLNESTQLTLPYARKRLLEIKQQNYGLYCDILASLYKIFYPYAVEETFNYNKNAAGSEFNAEKDRTSKNFIHELETKSIEDITSVIAVNEEIDFLLEAYIRHNPEEYEQLVTSLPASKKLILKRLYKGKENADDQKSA